MLCIYITAYYSALPTFHSRRAAFYRYLSHLRMTCREYRSVHVIRVSTRQILALRELCAYRVFDPRFVSCWPMFADLSVVRRRSARCLLKLCSRLRQTQNRTVYLLFCDLNLISIAAALKRDSCRLFEWLLFRLPHVIHVLCNFCFWIFFETSVLARDVRDFCWNRHRVLIVLWLKPYFLSSNSRFHSIRSQKLKSTPYTYCFET